MDKNGVIILHKEAGMTSQTAVNRVKRIMGIAKAGHTGTLDPMATGVLPILCGNAVRMSEYLTESQKHYVAVLRLGEATETEDVTGSVTAATDHIPTESEIRAAATALTGDILQIPPMYSALKRDGKKLVDLARKGIEIEREPRPITVYSLDVEKCDDRHYRLDVVCSKGTYIRTLCADLAKQAGGLGAMESLMRVEAAGFTLDRAVTLDALSAMCDEERARHLIPTEALVEDFTRIDLPPFFAHLAQNGCEIYLRKIGVSLPVGTRVRFYDNGRFFATGLVSEFENGIAARPTKQFR